MAGGFKRSKWFGLIGVLVVAALAIVIATTMGRNDPIPKLGLGLIFAVIAIFFAVLFLLQRSDLELAAGGDRAPAAVLATLAAVPNSVRWKPVEVSAGQEGIVVSHKRGEQRDWLCDLWLAERLAAA